MSTPSWMPVANSFMGESEIAGVKKNNETILSFFEAVGHGHIKNDEVSWCSAFVGACFEEVGIQGTGSLLARSWLKWGKEVSKPKYGDVVVFWRGSKKSWMGHVAFFVKEDSKYVWVLGGNQKNSVNVSKYPKSQVLGYRRPPSMSRSRTVAATGVASAAAFAAPLTAELAEVQETVAGVPMDWTPYVVSAIALVSLGIILWARWCDLKNKGR